MKIQENTFLSNISQVLVTLRIRSRDSRRLHHFVEMRSCGINPIIREIAMMYVENYIKRRYTASSTHLS